MKRLAAISLLALAACGGGQPPLAVTDCETLNTMWDIEEANFDRLQVRIERLHNRGQNAGELLNTQTQVLASLDRIADAAKRAECA